MFFHGKRHILLYTERFHFFRRYRIKGIRHVIFYGLPLYPQIYSEIMNLMQVRPAAADADVGWVGWNGASCLGPSLLCRWLKCMLLMCYLLKGIASKKLTSRCCIILR